MNPRCRPTEISDWLKTAFIKNVRRVRSDEKLALVEQGIFIVEFQDIQYLADKDLLQLRVQMYLRFFDAHPLSVAIQKLDNHIDEILESEAVIAVG